MEVTNSRDDFILTEVLAANIVYLLLTRAITCRYEVRYASQVHVLSFHNIVKDTHKQQYLRWNGLIGESFPYTIKCIVQLYECILSLTSLNNSIGGTRDFHVTKS